MNMIDRLWPGCEMCRDKKEMKSDNFCGCARLRVVGSSLDVRGDGQKIKFFKRIYAPNFPVKFCPYCGRPLTPTAAHTWRRDMTLQDLYSTIKFFSPIKVLSGFNNKILRRQYNPNIHSDIGQRELLSFESHTTAKRRNLYAHYRGPCIWWA